MELRHLRYFLAVAEEQHFGRAAVRLNMDQSPLSRAIRELESDLGVELLSRDKKGTRLTWAGAVFLKDARRVFAVLEHAKAKAASAATGYRGTLRVALSDGVSTSKLAALLAQCREEEPEVEIRLAEVLFSDQLQGFQDDLYDIGFTRASEAWDGLVSKVAWQEHIFVVLPARHPLLVFKEVPLIEVVRFPLVLCRPDCFPGWYEQMQRLIQSTGERPAVVEHVISHGLMMALVSAGLGIGFTTEALVANVGVVARPIADASSGLITYLVHPTRPMAPQAERFAARVCSADCVQPLS